MLEEQSGSGPAGKQDDTYNAYKQLPERLGAESPLLTPVVLQ